MKIRMAKLPMTKMPTRNSCQLNLFLRLSITVPLLDAFD